MVKYVIFPGPVTSKTDGDRHYITAPQLARLYGVDIKLCRVVHRQSQTMPHGCDMCPGELALHPKYNGDYTLPIPPSVSGEPSGAKDES